MCEMAGISDQAGRFSCYVAKVQVRDCLLRSSLILRPQLTLAVLQWRKSGKAIQSLGISDRLKMLLSTQRLNILL